jgi:hypothetical protein
MDRVVCRSCRENDFASTNSKHKDGFNAFGWEKEVCNLRKSVTVWERGQGSDEGGAGLLPFSKGFRKGFQCLP